MKLQITHYKNAAAQMESMLPSIEKRMSKQLLSSITLHVATDVCQLCALITTCTLFVICVAGAAANVLRCVVFNDMYTCTCTLPLKVY